MKLDNQLFIYCRTKIVEYWTVRLNMFYRGSIILLALLWLVRLVFPSVLDGVGEHEVLATPEVVEVVEPEAEDEEMAQPVVEDPVASSSDVEDPVASSSNVEGPVFDASGVRSLNIGGQWHKVRGVHSYEIFSDLQETQLPAAQEWGIRPARNRDEAEKLKQSLVYVGGSPYYHIDEAMSSSLPYLVPKASELLNRIGRNFFDSLYVKHLPLHKIIVSSVWRTESDVSSLSRFNPNATKQSCHLYATTIDISYVRFQPLPAPKGRRQRVVGDDILKYVLSEVLRDLREEGACYVKHERKMPCFHITVR